MRTTLLFLGTLAILNVFAMCLAMPAFEAIGAHDTGVLVQNGLNTAQLNLLGMFAALLSRRLAVSVVIILTLTWLKMQWYEIIYALTYGPRGLIRSPWTFLHNATLPFEVLVLFHGLRIALGWQITRDEKIPARAGQFQTRDLLEWMFTIAATLGVMTSSYAQLSNPLIAADPLNAADLLNIWIHSALHMLTVCPLALVLLSERPKARWFLGIAVAWIALAAASLIWESWQDTRSVWPTRALTFEHLQGLPAHRLAMFSAIVLNSLALRYWGYRWRTPVRLTIAS